MTIKKFPPALYCPVPLTVLPLSVNKMPVRDFHRLLQILVAVTHCVSHTPACTPPSLASQSGHPTALLFPQASAKGLSFCLPALCGRAQHTVLEPLPVHCNHSTW